MVTATSDVDFEIFEPFGLYLGDDWQVDGFNVLNATQVEAVVTFGGDDLGTYSCFGMVLATNTEELYPVDIADFDLLVQDLSISVEKTSWGSLKGLFR